MASTPPQAETEHRERVYIFTLLIGHKVEVQVRHACLRSTVSELGMRLVGLCARDKKVCSTSSPDGFLPFFSCPQLLQHMYNV